MCRPQAPRGARSGSWRPRPIRSTLWPSPVTGKAFFVVAGFAARAYSAALATAAFSFSSKASIRRAVACGDFVKRASRL
jgi:hypothetical protein